MRRAIYTILSASIFASGILLFEVSRSSAQPEITVGPNVQVSTDRPNDDHYEVRIDADPANGGHLIACSHVGVHSPTLVKTANYVSEDGGMNWHLALLVGGPISSGDPECAFGLHGEVYALSLEYSPDQSVKFPHPGVRMFRSSNSGKSWQGPAWGANIDREYFTIDRTGGKYNGRIYVNGTGVIAQYDLMDKEQSATTHSDQTIATMFHSADNGRSFSTPVNAATDQNHWILGMGPGVVLSDGTFGFVFGEWMNYGGTAASAKAPNGWIKFITSSDGGEHYSGASVITERRTCDMGPIWGGGLIPSIAIDRTHGPFRDRIYVAYNSKQGKRCPMFVSFSNDKGKTWSQGVLIDRDSASQTLKDTSYSTIPAIAVNNKGIVGLTWYDRHNDPHNYMRSVRFAASVDGGLSFTTPIVVSTVANNPSWSDRFGPPWASVATTSSGNIKASINDVSDDIDGGDTGGLAADTTGAFHPIWNDDRTHVSQLWTTRIEIAGAAEKNGDSTLSGFQDVTDQVKLSLNNANFDALSGTLTMDAVVENTSNKALHAPIKMRLMNISSGWGDVSLQTSDNGQMSNGAVWDFALPVGRTALAPKAKTLPKHVTFIVKNLQPINNEILTTLDDSPAGLVNFEARALAMPSKK